MILLWGTSRRCRSFKLFRESSNQNLPSCSRSSRDIPLCPTPLSHWHRAGYIYHVHNHLINSWVIHGCFYDWECNNHQGVCSHYLFKKHLHCVPVTRVALLSYTQCKYWQMAELPGLTKEGWFTSEETDLLSWEVKARECILYGDGGVPPKQADIKKHGLSSDHYISSGITRTAA